MIERHDEHMKAAKPPPRFVKITAPLALRLAGRRWFPLWAVVRHRGRSSGREYSIPVAVISTESTFLIGLPWGVQTNWVRNVMAAGGCTIRWKGVEHKITRPALVAPAVAVAAAGPVGRQIFKRIPVDAYLELQR